jgi:hypothetical protein
MIRILSVVLCLSLPVAAFAEDPAPPSADAPAQPALLPADAAPQVAPAVAEARYCSGHHCGCGGGKAKWIVLTGITATVITAVAVGTAVAVANANSQPVVR